VCCDLYWAGHTAWSGQGGRLDQLGLGDHFGPYDRSRCGLLSLSHFFPLHLGRGLGTRRERPDEPGAARGTGA
jgi:hypothetical protein